MYSHYSEKILFGYFAYDEVSTTLVTTCSQWENFIVEGKKY